MQHAAATGNVQASNNYFDCGGIYPSTPNLTVLSAMCCPVCTNSHLWSHPCICPDGRSVSSARALYTWMDTGLGRHGHLQRCSVIAPSSQPFESLVISCIDHTYGYSSKTKSANNKCSHMDSNGERTVLTRSRSDGCGALLVPLYLFLCTFSGHVDPYKLLIRALGKVQVFIKCDCFKQIMHPCVNIL